MKLRPGQVEPNDFERAILDHIATTDSAVGPEITQLRVLSREYTGVGGYTRFSPSAATRAERPIPLHALISVPGVANGMGAVLWCKGSEGAILEVFTYGDHWDGVHDGFSIEEID